MDTFLPESEVLMYARGNRKNELSQTVFFQDKLDSVLWP